MNQIIDMGIGEEVFAATADVSSPTTTANIGNAPTSSANADSLIDDIQFECDTLQVQYEQTHDDKLQNEQEFLSQIITLLQQQQQQVHPDTTNSIHSQDATHTTATAVTAAAAAAEASSSSIPDWCYCPISRELMIDPVQFDCQDFNCSVAFDRISAEEWINTHENAECPICLKLLRSKQLRPIPVLKEAMQHHYSSSSSVQEQQVVKQVQAQEQESSSPSSFTEDNHRFPILQEWVQEPQLQDTVIGSGGDAGGQVYYCHQQDHQERPYVMESPSPRSTFGNDSDITTGSPQSKSPPPPPPHRSGGYDFESILLEDKPILDQQQLLADHQLENDPLVLEEKPQAQSHNDDHDEPIVTGVVTKASKSTKVGITLQNLFGDNSPIIIKNIIPGGLFDSQCKNATLKKGMLVVAVNGIDIGGFSAKDAVDLLRFAGPGEVSVSAKPFPKLQFPISEPQPQQKQQQQPKKQPTIVAQHVLQKLKQSSTIKFELENRPTISCCKLFDNNSKIVIGTKKGTLDLYDLSQERPKRLARSLVHAGVQVRCCNVFAGDSKLVTTGKRNSIYIWDIVTWDVTMKLTDHTDVVRCISIIDGENKMISGSDDGTLKVWDLMTGEVLKNIVHGSPVYCCAGFANNPTMLLSGGKDKTIRVWDWTKRDPLLKRIGGHKATITFCSMFNDDTNIVSQSSDGITNLWIWNLQGKCTIFKNLRGHNATCSRVFANGTKLVSGYRNGGLIARSIESFLSFRHWNDRPAFRAVTCCDVDDDGYTIASGDNCGFVHVWRAALI